MYARAHNQHHEAPVPVLAPPLLARLAVLAQPQQRIRPRATQPPRLLLPGSTRRGSVIQVRLICVRSGHTLYWRGLSALLDPARLIPSALAFRFSRAPFWGAGLLRGSRLFSPPVKAIYPSRSDRVFSVPVCVRVPERERERERDVV